MRFSLGLLSSTQGTENFREDETSVANHIKSKLSIRDAIQFDKLHNDLKDKVIQSHNIYLAPFSLCFIITISFSFDDSTRKFNRIMLCNSFIFDFSASKESC